MIKHSMNRTFSTENDIASRIRTALPTDGLVLGLTMVQHGQTTPTSWTICHAALIFGHEYERLGLVSKILLGDGD